MNPNNRPRISTPLPEFLRPILTAQSKAGLKLTFSKVEGNVIFINMSGKTSGCTGCRRSSIRAAILRKVRRYYPNIVNVVLISQ